MELIIIKTNKCRILSTTTKASDVIGLLVDMCFVVCTHDVNAPLPPF